MKQKDAFAVVYEDAALIGVDKVSGVAVTADRWDGSKERLDRLLNSFISEQRVFTVHRIDRDTSGLVVFAKTPEAHKYYSRAFEDRRVKKSYIAVVHGRPAWKEEACDLPLVPNGDKKHRTIIDKYRGKKALTRFRFIGGAGNYSILEALPETGRTHQIRVHLAALGHPILCDPLYGNAGKGIFLSSFKKSWRGDPVDERPLLARLGLHAARLSLPCLSESPDLPPIELQAPLPRDMAALIRQMEKASGDSFSI